MKKITRIKIEFHLTEWHLIPFRHLDSRGFTFLFFDVLIY